MSKSIKLKSDTYWDSSNISYSKQPLSIYLDNNASHIIYDSTTGKSGWLKIADIGTTGGWGNRTALLAVNPSNNASDGLGIIVINYYNNSTILLWEVCGNLNLDNLIAIKNSDNNLSIYYKTTYMYEPLFVTPIGGNCLDVFNGTGYIGDTLPSGTQYKFTKIT